MSAALINGWEWWSLIGGVFEFAGLWVVVIGINRRQKEAGRLELWPALRNWIALLVRNALVRLKLQKPRAQTLEIPGIASASAVGDIRVKGSATVAGTIEEQVAGLQRALAVQDQRIDQLEDRLKAEIRDREAGDKKEHQERESALERVNASLKAVAAGDLGIEALGVLLFAIGVGVQTVGTIGP